ncbi:MAG: transcription-repair coupling factor, partial [Clostridiales bacterium]|nr:transcription-repair coupling factor [Clostridiales bacterium]
MNIFYDICKKLPFYQELETAVIGGYTPVSLTGVSNIHKAHTVLGLSELSPVLVICDDESSARRMTADINQLADKELCCFYPAKDYNFAYLEGISMEYEHQRIETLSKIKTGQCRIMAASCEACMQGTIPPDKLDEYSFEISSGVEISVTDLTQKLVASGYVKSEQVEGQSQFSIRGSIIDIFPVQSNQPVRIELWGDEVDLISYFNIESQRRTDSIDKITIRPALEIIFQSNEWLANEIEKLEKEVRGKKSDKISSFLNNDIELLRSGISLTNTDKYYMLVYKEIYTVLDYFDGITVISEYQNCFEKSKGILGQFSEDLKLMYEEGILFKQLDGFYYEFPQMMLNIEKKPLVFLDTFMRGGTDIRFKKLINSNCYQTASWGGDIKQLIEELTTFIEQKYCVIVFAGSEKTVPIIVNDLREVGLPSEIYGENSKIIPKMVYVRTGAVSGGFEYNDIKCALLTQMKA